MKKDKEELIGYVCLSAWTIHLLVCALGISRLKLGFWANYVIAIGGLWLITLIIYSIADKVSN